MEPEELFGTLLALGECWWVKGVTYQESLRRFVIEIEETDQLWSHERCPRDGGDVRLYDHAPSRQWRHLNVFNHECVLQCALPRGKCLDCRHVYRVQPPWEGKGKHFSKEFEAFALTLCREMPVKRASDILGESDQSLWRMLKAYVSEAHEQLEMSKVTCVGVDEMSIAKGIATRVFLPTSKPAVCSMPPKAKTTPCGIALRRSWAATTATPTGFCTYPWT